MREITLNDMERLGAFDEADRTFQMTEEAFRTFYELTARPVRVYLARMTGDDRLADDLLQETYYRFLRANAAFESPGSSASTLKAAYCGVVTSSSLSVPSMPSLRSCCTLLSS